MPRDGALPPQPPQRLPTRDEIIATIRQQHSGHLIEQIINLEADKAVLTNEVLALRRRVAEVEAKLSVAAPHMVEPADAGAARI